MNVESSAVLLKHLMIQLLASKACDGDICWFISNSLLSDLAWTLFRVSLVERLGLIELLSVLSSILVSVEVLLGGPGSTIPKSRVHGIAGAVVEKSLSWAIKVCLILNVLVEFSSSLSRKDLLRLSASKDAAGMSLWVQKACPESGFVWRILRMVIRMSERLSSGAISPRSCIKRIISLGNESLIETGG